MKIKLRNTVVFLLLSLSFSAAKAQFYDGSHVSFGKSRVQYNDFLWKFYKFENFETYFYKGGDKLAEYTARYAPKYIDQFESYFDYNLDGRIKFIIYNTQSAFKQSNVGIEDGDEYNIGGVTQIYGTKVFIYFNGNYQDFQRQIKAGIVQVLLYQIIYGSNWREVLKNSALLTLPDWYTKGLVSYLSEGWNPEIANNIKDGVASGLYAKFNRLDENQSIMAGHAIWYYIAQTYGKSIIPNIISMTRISRSIQSGFVYVLGTNLKGLLKADMDYYRQKFNLNNYNKKDDVAGFKPIKKHFKKHTRYENIRLSPDGNKVAYVTNKLGKYRLFVYNLTTHKRKKIYRGGQKLGRIDDYSFPQIAWHPTGKVLAFTEEKKGRLLLHFYNFQDKKLRTRTLFNLDKILDLDYAPNGLNMAISAVRNGQTDLYLYNIAANTQKNLTNDIYDDLHPRFTPDGKNIVFASNRPDDTLRKPSKEVKVRVFDTQKDIFIYHLNSKKNLLTRVTNTPKISELQPAATDSLIYYLAPYNHILNRFSAKYDSSITLVDTTIHYRYYFNTNPVSNLNRNIEDYNINNSTNKIAEIRYFKNRYRLYLGDLNNTTVNNQSNYIIDTTKSANHSKNQNVTYKLKAYPIKIDTALSANEIDFLHYKFENEKNEPSYQKQTIVISDKKNNTAKADTTKKTFHLPNKNNYLLSFFTDNTTTQLSNEFLNREYQTFNGGPYISPGLGAVIKLGASDVFENKKVFGGFRIGGSSREYFMAYANLKKRLDKEVFVTRTILRSRGSDGSNAPSFNLNTHTGNLKLNYPFNEVSHLTGLLTVRNDHLLVKATDLNTIQIPNQDDYWASYDLSYVFDNTRFKSLNIKYGTKFKLFGQYFKEISKPHNDMIVLGLDFRHYQKLSRNLIWVSRLSGSTSFGKEKIDYYLGSVDGWMILGNQPRFNTKTNIDYAQNYRFQALAAPLRGFNQNVRNGNSFAVLNNEIRWPFIKYFSNRPIKSAFFRYMQIVTFGDVGTAWTGTSPYDDNNLLNKEVIGGYPVKVTLYNSTNPIVGGFGFGLRTKMLGYFVRADYAWGVLDGAIQKPIFYLSLTLDI